MPKEQRVLIRTSERSAFKTCRQAWFWAYVCLLKPLSTSHPLFLGSMVHAALEAFYIPGIKRGPHPAETFARLWREHLEAGGEEMMVRGMEGVSLGDLGIEMLKNYVDEYGDDEQFEVIAPEMTFQVDIHHPVSGRYLFTAVGTADGVIRNVRTKKIGFIEHKTGASLEPFSAPLPLDDQNGAYWTFAPFHMWEEGILPEGKYPTFMMYNRLRKAFKDERPKNEAGHSLNSPSKAALVSACEEAGLDTKGTIPTLVERLKTECDPPYSDRQIELLGEPSKNQPTPLFKREFIPRGAGDRRRVMASAIGEARDMRLARAGKLAIYKNPGKHCGYCDFRDMCEVHETDSDWKSIRDNTMTTWDPYDAHEIAMERFM